MTTFFIVLLLSYLYHGFGITIGYHRLLTHRSFKCPIWLEYLLVSGGYLCFEGSPLSWVTTHRVHHRYTDASGDPHSPSDGLWHSFMGWLFAPRVRLTRQQVAQISPDLCRDRVYRFLDMDYTKRHVLLCAVSCIAFRLVIFFALGPSALLANLLGSMMPFVGAFLVNSACHIETFGYRTFETEDSSRNVWWVGLIALGEGWHNNHHACPQSARHGLKAMEPDISWWAISLLFWLGLAKNIRLPRKKEPWAAA